MTRTRLEGRSTIGRMPMKVTTVRFSETLQGSATPLETQAAEAD